MNYPVIEGIIAESLYWGIKLMGRLRMSLSRRPSTVRQETSSGIPKRTTLTKPYWGALGTATLRPRTCAQHFETLAT
jgi:hypothetical protein